jgi:hypothetical protein
MHSRKLPKGVPATELAENTDPAKYPAVFRLRPDDLAYLPLVPTITPKRR